MRVLLNTKPLLFRKSGIGYYIENILQALRQEGVEVVPTVVYERSMIGGLGLAAGRLRGLLGRFYPPFVKPLGDALIRYVSGRKLSAKRFDVYHETGLERMPPVQAGKVCNLYDLVGVRFPEVLPPDLAGSLPGDLKRNFAEADRVIVNTAFIRAEAEELLGMAADRMDVIPLAPAARYHVTDRTASRERIRGLTEKEYVLYAGTIEPRKNLKTLIRAFADLRRRGHDLALVLAGGFGWKYDDILSSPADLGIRDSVVFTGYIDEATMNDLYNCAAVFVYPSLYEGFGLPPLEAMSCGVPVIISDIPPLREVAGEAALRFDVHDHEALADCIERALTDSALRRELAERGLLRVQDFSWQRAARETIRTYERVLQR